MNGEGLMVISTFVRVLIVLLLSGIWIGSTQAIEESVDFDDLAANTLMTRNLEDRGVIFPDAVAVVGCTERACQAARSPDNVIHTLPRGEFSHQPLQMQFASLVRWVRIRYQCGARRSGRTARTEACER